MRYFDKLPQGIAKPCEDLINYIENPDKSIELSGFNLFSDLGVDSDFIRSFDLDYLGSSYRIELEYVERHNGDSLYIRNNDRRLIQYIFEKFVKQEDGRIIFKHDGKLVGVKNLSSNDILEEVKKLDTSLKILNNEIILSDFLSNDFSDNEKNILLANLIKYAIIRSNKRYQIVNDSPEIKNVHQIKNMYSSLINLLKYKKQIILQGPPGTGKTRLAKEIAKKLLDDSLNKKNIDSENLSDDFLSKIFHLNDEIKSSNGSTKYVIIEARKKSIVVSGESRNNSDTITFDTLRDCINYPRKFPLGTGLNSQYRAAANFVNEILKSNSRIYAEKISLQDNDQFKIIQFHPSYTYEDFVRGIVTETKGDKIEYKNVNKTLGEFAEKAFNNYKSSSGNTAESNIDVWIDNNFEDFKNNIQAKLPEDETFLTGDISIFEVNDDHFKYAKKWQNPGYLKFTEFKELVKAILQNEIELSSSANKLNKDKFLHAHYRFTYYNALLNKFFSEYEYEVKNERVDLKNYVLIIDEINRANLSSVLGELIYALEYRGEAVESMYAVGNDSKLILPPNLYIIGTMNTADRSVGHIDYAIRRRFAFVDVLPKNLTAELDNDFMIDSFEKVTSLFLKNYNRELDYNEDSTLIERSEYLTNDFDPKDVWLGHSYFIKQYEKDENGKNIEDNPIDFELRKKYEIKPILEEYVKDGILKESAKEVINSL